MAGKTRTGFEIPAVAEGFNRTEAPHGSLLCCINVKDKKIHNYQTVSPTLWNRCPRDDKSMCGPTEEAVIGVEVPDIANPVNAGCLIRSFEPATRSIHH